MILISIHNEYFIVSVWTAYIPLKINKIMINKIIWIFDEEISISVYEDTNRIIHFHSSFILIYLQIKLSFSSDSIEY